MANILLTEVCVRSCPYCFAKQYMEGEEDKSSITMENIVMIADFLERSGSRRVSLLGGEPLLHPKVGEIIGYFIGRGFDVFMFTSGIMPNGRFEAFVEAMEPLMADEEACKKITFIVNVNEPRFSPKHEFPKVQRFLSTFGSLSTLSFNIYRVDYDVDFLIDYVLKYGLRRHVRFGIANPIAGAKNEYIHPDDFPVVGASLITALARMDELNITPGFDCGFPLCMFSDDALGKLYKYTRNGVSFECGAAVDIGPDLSCWSCFPLSNLHKRSLHDFQDYNEMYAYFISVQENYRKEVRGIYSECDECKHYDRGLCSGGCLAHVINRLHHEGNFRNIM
ncbi:MAG: radical SAM protein [Bacteroidales bacterium]|nr:radical SAM protein [Bacteroidales bacterium]